MNSSSRVITRDDEVKIADTQTLGKRVAHRVAHLYIPNLWLGYQNRPAFELGSFTWDRGDV